MGDQNGVERDGDGEELSGKWEARDEDREVHVEERERSDEDREARVEEREGHAEEREARDEDGERSDGHDGAATDGSGDWDEERDPDEWIVEDQGADPEAVQDDFESVQDDSEAARDEADGEGCYTCSVCGQAFDSSAELHRHLYRVGLVE